MRSFDEPCGSWHVTQPSRLGACSQRYGPRLSAWHDVHNSAMESPLRSSLTLVAPCTLWHVEHSIFPSRTGMWPDRSSLANFVAMTRAHSWVCVFVFQLLGLGLVVCTLWQSARSFRDLVLAAVPERVFAAVVARRAGLIDLIGRQFENGS